MQKVVQTVTYGAAYINLLLKHRNDRAGRTYPRLKEGSDHAVFLIPGFLGPQSVMLPLELRFEHEGINAFTFDLGLYSTLPFFVIVRRITQVIGMVRSLYPELRRLDIVAHSMGGLIAEMLITGGHLDGFDTRLVTLGTPFMGTWAALMGCTISFSAYEMLPVHPRYREQNGSRKRITAPFLSIAGDYDILAPAERCRHPDALMMDMPVDHAGLILRKKVFHAAMDFITTAP